MSTALLTHIVVADDFYCVSFIEASLSVREHSHWIIERNVVDVPMALVPTGLQTRSKLHNDCVKETLW